MSAHSRRRGRARVAVVLCTLAVVAGVAVAVTGLTGLSSRPSSSAGSPATRHDGGRSSGASGGVSGLTAGGRGSTAGGTALVIPALHVDAPLVRTGAVGAPGTASLTIPEDIHEVGWWDGTVTDGRSTLQEDAPAPGQPGVAIVAGHVDSAAGGPGALYDLKDLEVGDAVEITGPGGSDSFWRMIAPPDATTKAQLPPALFVTTGPPRLALVTCGGPFDSATGHYRDNVIVWAASAGTTPT